MKPKKMNPPSRRVGRGGGRKLNPTTIESMRVVANNPDEWFLIAEYASRGSASSAANRLRARDWDQELGLNDDLTQWEITSRSYEDREGAGVWVRLNTYQPARAGA